MADEAPDPKPDDQPPDCEVFAPALELPSLPEEDLKRFVDDFLSDRIFTDKHLHPGEMQQMLPMVFMPLALGALSQYHKDSLQQIGCIWEDMSKAGPRSSTAARLRTSPTATTPCWPIGSRSPRTRSC